ncbi:MAG: hypothetical protein NXI13_11115 [Proteobacteria bacterium]|nr:hypothetical protein [Pseudomonadota bacterium]
MLIEALKEQITALELGRGERLVLPLGLPAIDDALQGGLDLGAMHELVGPAAVFFAQVMMRLKGGTVFWLATENLNEEYYPPGLLQYDGQPERFIMVRPQDVRDVLKVAYEVLASNTAGSVLLEVQKPITQTGMRKLQIAVQNTDTLGLVLNPNYARNIPFGYEALHSSAVTRWHVGISDWTAEKTQIDLHLIKNRRGSPCRWTVEIDHATYHLHLASVSGE